MIYCDGRSSLFQNLLNHICYYWWFDCHKWAADYQLWGGLRIMMSFCRLRHFHRHRRSSHCSRIPFGNFGQYYRICSDYWLRNYYYCHLGDGIVRCSLSDYYYSPKIMKRWAGNWQVSFGRFEFVRRLYLFNQSIAIIFDFFHYYAGTNANNLLKTNWVDHFSLLSYIWVIGCHRCVLFDHFDDRCRFFAL